MAVTPIQPNQLQVILEAGAHLPGLLVYSSRSNNIQDSKAYCFKDRNLVVVCSSRYFIQEDLADFPINLIFGDQPLPQGDD